MIYQVQSVAITGGRQTFEFDKAVKNYSKTFMALSGGDDAAGHLAHQLNPMAAPSKNNEEQFMVQVPEKVWLLLFIWMNG